MIVGVAACNGDARGWCCSGWAGWLAGGGLGLGAWSGALGPGGRGRRAATDHRRCGRGARLRFAAQQFQSASCVDSSSRLAADSVLLFSECPIEASPAWPPETAPVSGRPQAARTATARCRPAAGQASALWACAQRSASATVERGSARCSRMLQPSRFPSDAGIV